MRSIRKKLGAACVGALLLFCVGNVTAQDTKAETPKVTLTEAQMAALDGQYQEAEEPEIVLSIYHEDGKIWVTGKRIPPLPMGVISATKLSSLGGEFEFHQDAQGVVTGASATGGRQALELKRISSTPERFVFPAYEATDVMIPVRDGVKLHAIILRPKDMKQPLPFLLTRTPYGVEGSTSDGVNAGHPELAKSGYIFVFQDIRGRYKSEGVFEMNRALQDHANPKLTDESTDAYDTVAWLIKNVADNNGRVGVMGISYPGFTAMEAGIDPHPAVKAISPQAPMIDAWMGDDFFHNGAFRETYGYDYIIGMESSKENAFGKLDEDAYEYFLKQGSYDAAMKTAKAEQLPTAQTFLKHPTYDSYWYSHGVQNTLHAVAVPTLTVGGYWDQEDMWGAQEEYRTLEPFDKKNENFLVLGPWNHGGWAGTRRRLGAVDFGRVTTDEYRQQFEAPFFAYYLKDEPGFSLKDTAAFQTGSNEWKVYSHWPPRESKERNLYLGIGGELSFDKPSGKDGQAFTAYVSDPATPVLYRHRPIQATYAPGSQWYTWLVEDQRFVDGRPDVAVWKTAVLDKDVTVTGDVVADIFASTSGTDSDWVVKLIDVYPEEKSEGDMAGFELMTNMEIFRGRYRTSFEHPEPTPANAVEEYKFGLHAANHVFKKGHRIMVEVQSTWFPLYDRNPQKYVTSIMTAQPADFTKATQKVYSSAAHPSHIILPLAE
jgi:putative CocE/NonD family hydrolase